MGAVVMRAATIPGPVELTWRGNELMAGAIHIGDIWMQKYEEHWCYQLGINENFRAAETKEKARAALLAAAERALRGKE